METNRISMGKRIAIFENDPHLCEALVLFLRVKGWSVETFGSGEESAGVANWGDFMAVVCDFLLPGEDGLSVLRRVRKASETVVTVLITADSGGDVSANAESAGVNRILFKPFTTRDFEESLQTLTRNHSRRRSDALTPLNDPGALDPAGR
jgi:DNA-binding response OmpR family regulator